MTENDQDDMEAERVTRDYRKWHITREIPLPLIWAVLVFVFGGGMAYREITNKIEAQDKGMAEFTSALKETNGELRALAKQWQEGSVPTAELAWKTRQNEASIIELKTRQGEDERQDMAREARLQRIESMLSATNARLRAREER